MGSPRARQTSGLITRLALAACLTLCCSPQETRPKVPNVVWVVLDACRADHLSAFGYERKTSPEIDQLAARGAIFLEHYSQASNTLASLPSYMTGRFEPVQYQDPGHLGIWFLREPPADEKLASEIFAENGYATGIFSASPWYSERSRLGRSFQVFGELAHGGIVEGETFRERNPELFGWLHETDRPFFLYLHSLDTHEPRYENNTLTTWLSDAFPADRDRELRRWGRSAKPPFSTADRARIAALYDGGVAYADSTVGELLRALEEMAQLEDTIVVISSDHGEALAEDGQTLGHPIDGTFDELLHVPLVIAGPGVPTGTRVRTRTQNTDILPTLVDLLQLETSARFDGKSLLPAMLNPDLELHEYIYAASNVYTSTGRHDRILILGNLKLVFRPRLGSQIGSYEAWRLPDPLGERRPAAPTPEELARAKELVTQELLPPWRAKRSFPREPTPLSEVNHAIVPNLKAISFEAIPTDGKWALWRSEGAKSAPVLLMGHPSREQLPELSLELAIPDGIYRVSVNVEPHGIVATGDRASFTWRAQKDAESTLVRFPLLAAGPPEGQWVALGTYAVEDEIFQYAIGPGIATDIALAGRLRFELLGSDGEPIPDPAHINDLERQREQLRAVGYLD